MPAEIRRLSFSDAEVARAIVGFNAHSRQKFLPSGNLGGIRLVDEPVLHIYVSVETGDGGLETVVLNETMIGAAIIRDCIASGVPLPLRSTKSLKLVNGELAFDISLPREPSGVTAPAGVQV